MCFLFLGFENVSVTQFDGILDILLQIFNSIINQIEKENAMRWVTGCLNYCWNGLDNISLLTLPGLNITE